MTAQRRHRQHAVRVAAVATLIVLAFYVVAVLVLNVIVTSHLVGTTDNRLTDRLDRCAPTDARAVRFGD